MPTVSQISVMSCHSTLSVINHPCCISRSHPSGIYIVLVLTFYLHFQDAFYATVAKDAKDISFKVDQEDLNSRLQGLREGTSTYELHNSLTKLEEALRSGVSSYYE